MSELELVTPKNATAKPAEEEGPDTDAEFRTLFDDAGDAKKRLIKMAASMEGGNPDGAKILREISGTVLSIVSDLIAATGGAIVACEDDISELEEEGPGGEGEPTESVLLEEDAEKYIALMTLYLRLLDELEPVIPAGSDGDKQREVFARLRRPTEELIAFTKEIGGLNEDGDDDDEEEDEAD
jgi:hypothetical protein